MATCNDITCSSGLGLGAGSMQAFAQFLHDLADLAAVGTFGCARDKGFEGFDGVFQMAKAHMHDAGFAPQFCGVKRGTAHHGIRSVACRTRVMLTRTPP